MPGKRNSLPVEEVKRAYLDWKFSMAKIAAKYECGVDRVKRLLITSGVTLRLSKRVAAQAPQEVIDEILRRYDLRVTPAKISREVGMTKRTVREILIAHGKIVGKQPKPASADKDKILELYRIGHTMQEIKKMTGYSINTVGKHVRKADLSRPRGTRKSSHQTNILLLELWAAGYTHDDICKSLGVTSRGLYGRLSMLRRDKLILQHMPPPYGRQYVEGYLELVKQENAGKLKIKGVVFGNRSQIPVEATNEGILRQIDGRPVSVRVAELQSVAEHDVRVRRAMIKAGAYAPQDPPKAAAMPPPAPKVEIQVNAPKQAAQAEDGLW